MFACCTGSFGADAWAVLEAIMGDSGSAEVQRDLNAEQTDTELPEAGIDRRRADLHRENPVDRRRADLRRATNKRDVLSFVPRKDADLKRLVGSWLPRVKSRALDHFGEEDLNTVLTTLARGINVGQDMLKKRFNLIKENL